MTAFAELHDDLRAVARDLLAPTAPMASGTGEPPAPLPWDRVADLGWLGLDTPEELGGSGATFAELAVVLTELGRNAATGPYLGCAVLAPALLARLDGSGNLLAGVVAGRTRCAVASPALGCHPGFRLEPSPSGPVLTGVADFVADAPAADVLLVEASGVVVALAPDAPGVTVAERPVVDATRRFGAVTADAVPVAEAAVMKPVLALGPVADRGALAVACDSLGLAEAALDATVAYAAERRQFGRAIGSFQAVKHACADMLIAVTVCRELVDLAVEAVASGDEAGVEVAMAKAHVCEAAVEVTGQAVQLHGGIGYTWERGLHLYLKRASLNRSLFGPPGAHRRRLAARYGGNGFGGKRG